MRSRLALVTAAALLLPPVLSGCALGAYISPLTPLERAVNGTYEGIGVGGTGRVPYRMSLTVQEREGRATGVITNLESRKAYAASGTFKRTTTGGALELGLFENGDKHRGNLHATLAGTTISGVLRTVLLGRELLGYNIELNQVKGAAPVATPAVRPSPASRLRSQRLPSGPLRRRPSVSGCVQGTRPQSQSSLHKKTRLLGSSPETFRLP